MFDYQNSDKLVKQDPVVSKSQIDWMEKSGFHAEKRNGPWVLWAMTKWPAVKIWLQHFQEDFSQQYIMMIVFKSGQLNGRTFQANEIRLSLGLSAIVDEDIERLSSFVNPWTQIDHHPS